MDGLNSILTFIHLADGSIGWVGRHLTTADTAAVLYDSELVTGTWRHLPSFTKTFAFTFSGIRKHGISSLLSQ